MLLLFFWGNDYHAFFLFFTRHTVPRPLKYQNVSTSWPASLSSLYQRSILPIPSLNHARNANWVLYNTFETFNWRWYIFTAIGFKFILRLMAGFFFFFFFFCHFYHSRSNLNKTLIQVYSQVKRKPARGKGRKAKLRLYAYHCSSCSAIENQGKLTVVVLIRNMKYLFA